eukprot:scaffold14668_cov55-Phaeocystis_antarctica.AAC.1
MATVCLSPHSPPLVRGGHLHAFDERVLLRSTNDMRNVWFGVLGRGIYQGRDPGLGADGWGRRADVGRGGAPCRR